MVHVERCYDTNPLRPWLAFRINKPPKYFLVGSEKAYKAHPLESPFSLIYNHVQFQVEPVRVQVEPVQVPRLQLIMIF